MNACLRRFDRWLTRAFDRPWEYPLSDDEARRRMPWIVRGLASDDQETRFLAAAVAEHMGPQAIEAEPLLFAMVDDDDDMDCRESALMALMAIRPDSADRVRFVGRFLNEGPGCVAACLHEHATDLRPILAEIVRYSRHKSAPARSWAATLLARPDLRGPKTLPRLRRLMADEDTLVREKAARRFIDAGGPAREAAAVHAAILDHHDPLARHEAAYDLGRLGRGAYRFLDRLQLLALTDEEEFVRRMAADAAQAVRGDPDAPRLDPAKYVRPYMEKWMRSMDGPDFIQDNDEP